MLLTRYHRPCITLLLSHTFCTLITARPTAAAGAAAATGNLTSRAASPLTVNALLAIAPTSATCADAPFPSECRTAASALPHILASFGHYGITHPAVQAALISLMAFESGEFKYDRNHFPAPGRPGQGTRNMQMPMYNVEYAKALGLSEEVWGQGAQGDAAGLMEAVGSDEYGFGSAAWFVTGQCGYEVREGMWAGTREGWATYLTGCVGADADEEGRAEYWERAMGALGVPVVG